MPALGWLLNLDFAGGTAAVEVAAEIAIPRHRIPHPHVPVEVRQAFQRRGFLTNILSTGTSGQILVGAGAGLYPNWSTSLTALTKLTVDNITIDEAVISSDSGAISFSNENLTTTGTIAGINVTSGADPGHTHTGASLSAIDISDDTNLAVSAPIVLTDDTVSVDQTDYLPSMTNNNAGTVYKCHVVYCDDNDDFDLAQSDGASTPEVIGLIESTSVAAAALGTIRTEGILTATTGQWDVAAGTSGGLTAGTEYYLSDANPGMLTATEPLTPGSTSVRIGIALSTTKLKLLMATAVAGEAAALPIITENTTLYVAVGGSDVTGDSTEGNPWATLAQALAWLDDKFIAAGVIVTIQFGDGVFERGAADTISHVNGDRINIIGENTHAKTMTSVEGAPGGGAGAWTVILNLDDVDDITTDDYLLVPRAMSGGTWYPLLCGCWEITNVDSGNSRITVLCTSAYGTPPSGNITGTVTVVKTILFYNGVNGIVLANNSVLGEIDKVVLLGDGTSTAITCTNRSQATCGSTFGINNFDIGLNSVQTSFIRADYCHVSNCASFNIQALYSDIGIDYASATGGGAIGVHVLSGRASVNYGLVCGNATRGIMCQYGAFAQIYNSRVQANTTEGVMAYFHSGIGALTTVITNNGTNFSPVINTEGNAVAYILG